MVAMVGKILFVVKPHSFVDIITNSSSELFVFNEKSKAAVESLIYEVYPDYSNEYRAVKTTAELTEGELHTYVDCVYNTFDSPTVIEGFSFSEMYKKEHGYYWIEPYFVKNNFEKIKEAIDPNNRMFFLFSIGDNPDWEKQEELMVVGERYHLG